MKRPARNIWNFAVGRINQFSSEYVATAERLFQLLDETRDSWVDTVEYPQSFSPNADFRKGNPGFAALVERVNAEFDFEMSDRQCSWAVLSFLRNTWANYLAVGPRLADTIRAMENKRI